MAGKKGSKGKKVSKKATKPLLTEEQRTILRVLSRTKKPLKKADIVAKSGLSSEGVTNRLKTLKAKGYIESPEKGLYTITAEGRNALRKR